MEGLGCVGLRSEDWGRVRLHDRLIYADLYDGVYSCKVMMVDIQVEGALGQYPYGKTKDTGAVRVEYEKAGVKVQLIENLGNLVKWNQARFSELKALWEDLQTEKGHVSAHEAVFNEQLTEARGL